MLHFEAELIIQKEYRSKYLEKAKKHKDDEQQMKKIHKKIHESGDFTYAGDMCSQYPASMRGVFRERVNMRDVLPIGYSRWSNEPRKEFIDDKYSFYEIKFIPNKKLIILILPRKKKERGIEWSLRDGKGVYANVDIENAIKHDYLVEFISKCLVWDETHCLVNILRKFLK